MPAPPTGGCVIAFDAASGREVWRAGHLGPELRLAGPRRRPWRAAGVRLRRGRIESPDRGVALDRPSEWRHRLRVPVPQPDLRVGQPRHARSCSTTGCSSRPANRTGRGARSRCGRTSRTRCSGRRASSPSTTTPPSTATAISTASTGATWATRRSRASTRRAGRWSGARRRRGRRPSRSAGGAGQQILGTARGSLLAADGQFLCLGELGHLLWMDLTPQGYREISRAWLVAARESWALPVLSRGLLYVVQNSRDLIRGTPPRLLCYDLRA